MIKALFTAATFAHLALAYTTHYVTVGGLKPDGTPNLAYYPNNFNASVGDKITFRFMVKNHTVTQSSFNSPCSKLTDSYGQPTGFDSGFMPVAPNATYFPEFTIDVKDTNPIWAYCQQINPPNPTHCQSGMVIGINPPTYGNTFDKFLSMAKSSTTQNTGSSSYTTSSYTSSAVTVTKTVTETDTTTITVDHTSTCPPTSTYSSTYSSAPTTHTIVVGGANGFAYSPANITANPGDTVRFQFQQKNHTVTQSSFNDPCRKLADTTWPPMQGFDSGFMPVAANATYFPTYDVLVNDTQPIWAYCRQQAANFSHCGVGMVVAINANEYSDKSFEAFQHLAVTKNGSGFVNQFGNLTAPPTTYGSGWPSSGSKNLADLDTLGSGSSDSDSSLINKLTNDYAPAILGLLSAVLILLVALIVISVILLRRSAVSIIPTRTVTQSYHAVPLTMPSSKMQEDGTHGYEETRYTDHDTV